jgi:hypothetical protein
VIIAVEGSSFKIIATAKGKGPLLYQWFRDALPAGMSDTMTFDSFSSADAGVYRCIAINVSGTDTSRAYEISLAEDTTGYIVNISMTPGGSVKRIPEKSAFRANEKLIVMAIADSGWEFDHWDGDIAGDDDSLFIVIAGTMSIRAVFYPILSGECSILSEGHHIAQEIRNIISTLREGIICVPGGVYNGKAVRIQGEVKVIVK